MSDNDATAIDLDDLERRMDGALAALRHALRPSVFRSTHTSGINSVRATAKNGIPPLRWSQWLVMKWMST